MSDLVIGDYTAAVSIDGATHFMLIQPGGASTAYKKISRDVLLGVTGQPADISTAQSITNKTLDNTNIATLRDDRFTLQDSGDVTKQATFQLSSITAGQTRVYTLPDVTDTLVSLTATQTLTDKTLTAPVISGGSISNSTIAVNAIGEFTAANGVTIDGLNIKDSKLNTSNSVVTANITAAAVTDAKLIYGKLRSRQGGSATTWTTSGTTTYDYSGTNVFVQVGARSGSGTTITFPTAYNQIPLVFVSVVTAGSQNAWARVSATTSTTFTYQVFINNTTPATGETIAWMAIGE